jgi:hypothetical protein
MSGARLAGLVDTDDLEPPVEEEAEAEEGEMPELVSAWWRPFSSGTDRGEVGPEEEERESERRASCGSAKGFSCSNGSTAISACKSEGRRENGCRMQMDWTGCWRGWQ